VSFFSSRPLLFCRLASLLSFHLIFTIVLLSITLSLFLTYLSICTFIYSFNFCFCPFFLKGIFFPAFFVFLLPCFTSRVLPSHISFFLVSFFPTLLYIILSMLFTFSAHHFSPRSSSLLFIYPSLFFFSSSLLLFFS
jgi:hypothetical protein